MCIEANFYHFFIIFYGLFGIFSNLVALSGPFWTYSMTVRIVFFQENLWDKFYLIMWKNSLGGFLIGKCFISESVL